MEAESTTLFQIIWATVSTWTINQWLFYSFEFCLHVTFLNFMIRFFWQHNFGSHTVQNSSN